MTKQQLIQWLKTYIQTDEAWRSKSSYTYNCKHELAKSRQKPVLEKPMGIVECIFSILLLGLILGFVFAVIWCIFTFAEIIIVDFKSNPNLDLKSLSFHHFLVGFIYKGDFNEFSNHHPVLFTGAAFFMLGIIPAFFINLISFISSRAKTPERNQQIMHEYKMRQTQIPMLEQKYLKAQQDESVSYRRLEELQTQNVVPKTYLLWAPEILAYLENQRADTLKEAINLLESELSEHKRTEELKRHNKQMEEAYAAHAAQVEAELRRNADAAERAASAAEDAAFWEAGRTFLVANELDKLKRK